jgi:ribosome-binding protein aMBF1 (putative translation factor)
MFESKEIQVSRYKRLIVKQAYRSICEVCGAGFTAIQYPGSKPRYCNQCKESVQREQARLRKQKQREREREREHEHEPK